MSNYDQASGFSKSTHPVTKSQWKTLRDDDSVVAYESVLEGDAVRMGFASFDEFLDELSVLPRPWEYMDDNETPELIHATASGLQALARSSTLASATPASTASNPPPSKKRSTPPSTIHAPGASAGLNPYDGLSADQRKALRVMENTLTDVNGQDAYSVTAMALGTLKKSEYLLLPDYMEHAQWPTDASLVGAPWDPSTSLVQFRDFVQIYALNKEAGKESKDPIFFGLLRAEAVKMGWYQGQGEVVFVPPKADAIATYIADAQAVNDLLTPARSTAFLVPFMAEYVFRTTGHHYLTGLADEYERKYMAMCSACLVPDMIKYLRASELWHWSMHWVSPRVARMALEALKTTERLPNAVGIRANAAPAGTAIVTTTAAVIDAMESCNWASEVESEGGFNFSKIKAATKEVKTHVAKYHAAYFAYGVAPPSAVEKANLAEAVTEAQKFAPIAQGFIDAMYADSSLAKAKALKKHADASPVLQRRALRVFRALSKADTDEISDIFRSTAADKKKAVTSPVQTAIGAP